MKRYAMHSIFGILVFFTLTSFLSCGTKVKGAVGGELGGEWIPVYVQLSPFVVHLKLSQHC